MNRAAEGEVVVLRKDEAGLVFPPYHARTIKIEAERKIIWKTYLDPGAGEPDGFGIVEFRWSRLPASEGMALICDINYVHFRALSLI